MAQGKNIKESILETEKKLALYKFVLEKCPDAKVHDSTGFNGFSSKSVNSNYTNYEFIHGYHSVYVVPYLELDFKYNDNLHKVRINSSPRSNRLVYLRYDSMVKGHVIKFSRLSFNLKNNNFKSDMLNDCRVRILEFIKDHPKYQIDYRHLEPRLKKLIMFT